MSSSRACHLITLVFCIMGVLSGLVGAITFGYVYHNTSAALWAATSGVLSYWCLFLEVLHQRCLLQRCHNLHSLLLSLVIACLSLAVALVASALHLAIAVWDQEPFPSGEYIEHSDYLVTVWSLLTAKWATTLLYTCVKCRRKISEELEEEEASRHCYTLPPPRTDSPSSQLGGVTLRQASSEDTTRLLADAESLASCSMVDGGLFVAEDSDLEEALYTDGGDAATGAGGGSGVASGTNNNSETLIEF